MAKGARNGNHDFCCDYIALPTYSTCGHGKTFSLEEQ